MGSKNAPIHEDNIWTLFEKAYAKSKIWNGAKAFVMVRVSFEPLFVASPMSSDVKTWPHVTLAEPSQLSDSPAKSALSSNWSTDNSSRVLIGGESWRPRCGAQRDYFNGQYFWLSVTQIHSITSSYQSYTTMVCSYKPAQINWLIIKLIKIVLSDFLNFLNREVKSYIEWVSAKSGHLICWRCWLCWRCSIWSLFVCLLIIDYSAEGDEL